MNPYKTAAIAVAAVVGVSSGAFAAFNLDGSDQVAPPVASASPSATPEGASPTPTESPSSAAPTEDPDKEASSEATSESAGGDTDGAVPTTRIPPVRVRTGPATARVPARPPVGAGRQRRSARFRRPRCPAAAGHRHCLRRLRTLRGFRRAGRRPQHRLLDRSDRQRCPLRARALHERAQWRRRGRHLPDLVSLSQGECATGDLVFMSGLDVDSTTMTFSNDYSEQLTFDIATD